MRTLLQAAPGRIKDCLTSQIGEVAARNSCFGPWTTSLNWQVNVRPAVLGLDRRLTISVQMLNSLTGLDLLFNGPNHLQGWGQPAPPDPTLLTITGFNASSNTYRYTVNTHFGRASANQAYGQPFQFILAARLNVGPADAAQQLRSLFNGRGGSGGGGGRGGGNPGAPGSSAAPSADEQRQSLADDIADRFSRRLRNPFAMVLSVKDSLALALTPAQVDSLGLASARFQDKADSITGVVRQQLKNLGATLDATTMSGIMRHQQGAVRELEQQALDDLHRLITPDQWNEIPDRVKGPPTAQGRPPR